MGAALLVFCTLSGKWWVFRYTLFFIGLGTLLFLWSLYLEYNTQVALDLHRPGAQYRAYRRI